MSNHYHLVIERPEGNLSKGMRQLNGVYTQRFNRRHKCSGHIFQGRYKAILVDREAYLLAVARYVVLNPVRAGMVSDPASWPWSSYGATVELAQAQGWLATRVLLRQFGQRLAQERKRYAQFVQDGYNRISIWEGLQQQISSGMRALWRRCNRASRRRVSWLRFRSYSDNVGPVHYPRLQPRTAIGTSRWPQPTYPGGVHDENHCGVLWGSLQYRESSGASG